MKWVAFFIIFVLGFSSCPAQEASDEAIFKERLQKWVEAVNTLVDEESDLNMAKVDDTLREIRKFAREYPQSKYADDAEFVRHNSIESDVETWEQFAAKYPEVNTEEFTREELRKLKGKFSAYSYECLIPYELMPLYMRGKLAWIVADYKEVEKYWSDFALKIEFGYSDFKKDILPDIYYNLMNVYKALGKRKEYDKVKDKYVALCPDKRAFAERHWQ
jgi:hypothetical protein